MHNTALPGEHAKIACPLLAEKSIFQLDKAIFRFRKINSHRDRKFALGYYLKYFYLS